LKKTKTKKQSHKISSRKNHDRNVFEKKIERKKKRERRDEDDKEEG